MVASGWVGTTWRRSTGAVRWARPSSSSRPGRRRGAARAAACVAALILVHAAAAPAEPAASGDPDTEQARQALALARSDSFYLVLDLRRAELHLMLGGVPLSTFSYTEAAVARPQVAFRPGPTPGDWTARTWQGGALAPARRRERVEITPPRPGATDAPGAVVPPLPGEGPPPPARFLVRFAGGLELEILQDGTPRHGRLRDRLELLRSPRQERLRLRLVMPADDAVTLYRCLPPGVGLVVLGRPA